MAQPPPRKVKVHDALGCLLTGGGSLYLAGLWVVDRLRIVRRYPCLWAGWLLVGWVSGRRWQGGRPECHPSTQSQSRVRVRRASISEPSDTDLEPRTLDPSPAGKSALVPSLPRPSPVFPVRWNFSFGGVQRYRGPLSLSCFFLVWGKCCSWAPFLKCFTGTLILRDVKRILWPDTFGRC